MAANGGARAENSFRGSVEHASSNISLPLNQRRADYKSVSGHHPILSERHGRKVVGCG
jgi:hypothetical protein